MPETVSSTQTAPETKEDATIQQITSVLDYLPASLVKGKTAHLVADGAIVAIGLLSLFSALNIARRSRQRRS